MATTLGRLESSTAEVEQATSTQESFRPHFWLMVAGLATAIGVAAYSLLPALF
jgi:hypothetical protein